METFDEFEKYSKEQSEKLVSSEQDCLKGWRKKRERSEAIWTGLALSGGGIRTSTFCLGVFQALANKDLLKNFDYISTVSGGGYIGTSLQWWWSNKPNEGTESSVLRAGYAKVKSSLFSKNTTDSNHCETEVLAGLGPKDFPYGTQHPNPALRGVNDTPNQENLLKFLRANGNYLIPGNGINFWSALGVVIRSILLNILVWILIAAFLFILLTMDFWRRFIGPFLENLPNNGSPLPEGSIGRGWGEYFYSNVGLQEAILLPPLFAICIWIGYVLFACFLLGSLFFSFQTSSDTEDKKKPWTGWRVIKYLGYVAFFFGSAWVVQCFFISFLTDLLLNHTGSNVLIKWMLYILGDEFIPIVQFVLTTAAYILVFFGVSTFFALVIGLFGVKDMGDAYRLRRNFEKVVGRLFKWALLITALGLVPVIFTYSFKISPSVGMAGLFSIGAGVAAALWGQYQTVQKIVPGLATKIFLPVGALLFLVGLVVLGYEIALVTSKPALLLAFFDDGKINEKMLSRDAEIFIKYVLSCLIGLALISVFVVNTNQISLNRFYRDRLIETFMPKKSAVISGKVERSPVAERTRICDFWKESAKAPYPIINTNVVLVNDDNKKFRIRGGDNYILSPHYCGSAATNWYPSNGKASAHITLASAMAASGAAANPNAGYVGTGPTRGRLVSAVMMLLNIRLGYWIPHPISKLILRPTHFSPGGNYTLTKNGFRSNSGFLELSDGGHFENLGVYELVRRKCKLIVVCDGEADLTSSYSALISLQRRIEEDFNATIIFEEHKGPELLVAKTKMEYPSGALCADLPYFVATIRYEDKSEGKIIYMKATMIKQLSFKSLGYKGANLDFPHETTADQFFSPEQFEAYRELGYCTGMEMINGLKLAETHFKNDAELEGLNDSLAAKVASLKEKKQEENKEEDTD